MSSRATSRSQIQFRIFFGRDKGGIRVPSPMGLGFLANPQQDDGLGTSVKEGGAAPPSLPPLPPASPSTFLLQDFAGVL